MFAMHTHHRPPPSPIAKIMPKVPLKIHLHVNCYYFPGHISRSKNVFFFILSSESGAGGLFSSFKRKMGIDKDTVLNIRYCFSRKT